MPAARHSTQPPAGMPGGVASNFAIHAKTRPNFAALIVDGQTLSWQNLHDHVERIAAAIASRTKPGARIALHLPQGLNLALLFLGCARAGREALIMDAHWPQQLVATTLQRLVPDLFITTRDLPPVAGLAHVVVPAEQMSVDDFIGRLDIGAPGMASPAHDPVHDFDVTPQTPFYIALTSGSTGAPKACRRNHGSWLASFDADAIEFGIHADDIILAPGSLTHSLFVYALIHGLYRGATVILCSRFRPNDVLRLAREHHATVLYGVPTQIRMILDHARVRGHSHIPSLRWILATGAKWFDSAKSETRELFPHARFVEFYGASETSFITLAKDSEGVPQGSVGRAFPGVVVTIRDNDHAILPALQSGRVFVESEMLFSGYADVRENGPPDASLPLERVGGSIGTGDIGYLDERGFLFLVGRANRMIVTSGKNLYPEEVEAVLMRHPAIAQAALFAAADDIRGEKIIATIQILPDQVIDNANALTRHAVITYLRSNVPLFQVPRHYAVVRDWPLTPSGKTDFRALEQSWHEGAYEVLN